MKDPVDEVSDEATEFRMLNDTVEGMREILRSQTRLIDACLHRLHLCKLGEEKIAHADPEVIDVSLTMIHMLGISGHSVIKLTDEISMGVRDAYPIARSIVEGVINVLFIIAKGNDMAKKAKRHAEHKSFRDLQRSFRVGNSVIKTERNVHLTPEERARLDALATEFMGRNGREKPWIDENIQSRIDIISTAFPIASTINLGAATFNIYRHASEIVHGTYFAAMHFWGNSWSQEKIKNVEQMRILILNHQFSILSSVTLAFTALLECTFEYMDETTLKNFASKEFDRLKHLPLIAKILRSTDQVKSNP